MTCLDAEEVEVAGAGALAGPDRVGPAHGLQADQAHRRAAPAGQQVLPHAPQAVLVRGVLLPGTCMAPFGSVLEALAPTSWRLLQSNSPISRYTSDTPNKAPMLGLVCGSKDSKRRETVCKLDAISAQTATLCETHFWLARCPVQGAAPWYSDM